MSVRESEDAMRRWIVDGMNVIGAGAGGWWRDRAGAMQSLARELGQLAGAESQAIAVVFDGREPGGWEDVHGVEIAFAPGGPNSADDEIVRRVEADSAPEEICVFTSDRELAERVRAAGAEVAGATALRKRLGGDR